MSAVRDIKSNLVPLEAIAPGAIATDTTTVGLVIDTADHDGGSMFSFVGDVTDGTYTPLIQMADDAGFSVNVAAVPDENLIGTEAAAALSTALEISSLGVVNQSGRYLRLSIVSASTSTGAEIASIYHGKVEVAPV